MALLVQKFGGTSVNTLEKRQMVMDKVIAAKEKGYDVVVVVSAMGRKGEPYATDTFLDMLQDIGPDADKRTRDLLMSCGEIISACVLAHSLEQQGYKARPMTGTQVGIATDNNHTNAEIVEIKPERVEKALKQGEIVVIAGFQGCTEDLTVTTLGRGGSDTSAIAIGGSLGADLVEIYTDVPGIAFTDPRILPGAPFIDSIEFEPMLLLAKAGAKVIHPRAVRTAKYYNTPFVVRSTLNDEPGTVIGRSGSTVGGLYGVALLKDIQLIKIKGEDSADMWKNMAVDEMFYKKDEEGCTIAVQTTDEIEEEANKYTVTDTCEIITLAWSPESGIKAQEIDSIIKSAGVEIKGCFEFESAGAWALSKGQSADIIKDIFNVFQNKKDMAV